MHEAAVPRRTVRIGRQRALAAEVEVVLVGLAVGVADVHARQHRVDRGRDKLDVAELLRRDVRDQVVERTRALAEAIVERLERVVHQRRHLAELAAHQLLHGRSATGVRRGGRRKLRLPTVNTKEHSLALPTVNRADGSASVS
jgi:hypothetical protein